MSKRDFGGIFKKNSDAEILHHFITIKTAQLLKMWKQMEILQYRPAAVLVD